MSTKIICDGCGKELWSDFNTIHIIDKTYMFPAIAPIEFDVCCVDCMIKLGNKLQERRNDGNKDKSC